MEREENQPKKGTRIVVEVETSWKGSIFPKTTKAHASPTKELEQ